MNDNDIVLPKLSNTVNLEESKEEFNSNINKENIEEIENKEESNRVADRSKLMELLDGDGIQESLDKIFAAVIVGGINVDNPHISEMGETFRDCIKKFRINFPDNIFENEYAFLYEALKTLNVKVFSINQLNSLVYSNAEEILESPYINLDNATQSIDGRMATDEEKLEFFKLNLIEKFYALSNKYVTIEEYNSSVQIYVRYYTEKLYYDTVQKCANIVSDTGIIIKKTKKRSVLYKGVEDAMRYYREKISIVKSLSDGGIQSKHTVINEEWLADDANSEDELGEAVLTTGLPEIDEVMMGIRRTNMIGILGPPKGGKTRFTASLVARGLLSGLNVCVWPLEGNRAEWLAMILSYMCAIDDKSRSPLDCEITSQKIMFKRYDSDIDRKIVESKKLELAKSPKIGRLSFIEETLYVEDFIEVLQNHYDGENAFDIVAIDQLINTLSRERKGKVERVGEAYILLKDYITNKMKIKAVALLPAQLKQTTIDMIRKNPEDTIDVTGGGESADTIRQPDAVIGIFSSKEEREHGLIKLYSVANRHGRDFRDFYVRANLGCCYLESDSSLNDY